MLCIYLYKIYLAYIILNRIEHWSFALYIFHVLADYSRKLAFSPRTREYEGTRIRGETNQPPYILYYCDIPDFSVKLNSLDLQCFHRVSQYNEYYGRGTYITIFSPSCHSKGLPVMSLRFTEYNSD